MQNASAVTVRPVASTDIAPLLRINNAAVPAVNELTAAELEALIATALACLVAEVDGAPGGFLLCLPEGTDYESRNYAWLSQRLDRFAYTDRIAVDASLRGRNIGEALYAALFEGFADGGRPFVCEVNERPPNPGSVRFHKRLGFSELGRADHGDKAVVFLKRDPGA